jgi:hypothetical protein
MKRPFHHAHRFSAGAPERTGLRRRLASIKVIMSEEEICICIAYFLKAFGLLVLIWVLTAKP